MPISAISGSSVYTPDLSPLEINAPVPEISGEVFDEKLNELFAAMEEEGIALTPIYRAMAAIAFTTVLFNQLRMQSLEHLREHVEKYIELTDKQCGWTYAQAGIIAFSGLLSGGLGIGSGFITKPDIKADPSLGTVKTALEFSSKIVSSLGDAGRTMIQCPVTQYEARRTLVSQICFQEAHDRQASSQEVLRKIHQFILTLIEQKGRGG